MTPRTAAGKAYLDAVKTLEKAMSEDDLLTAIVEAALFMGWLVHHDRRSDKALQQGSAGFPDLVLARNGKLRFVELKSSRGQLTTEQFAWQRALPPDHWAIEYRLVRPSDLDDVIASLR